MRLDIRLPIGLMFLTFGLILTAFGFVSDKSIYAASLGININLGWGLLLVLFGACMLFLGWRGAKQYSSEPAAERAARANH